MCVLFQVYAKLNSSKQQSNKIKIEYGHENMKND